MFKKKINSKTIIFISITIIILFISFNFLIPQNKISKISKDGILFIQNIINKPILSIKNKIILQKDIKDNNEKIEQYQILKDKNEELEKEINILKEQLNINNTLTFKNIINSTVINRNLEYWYDTLTIDKGSNDGVIEGMAVLYKGYLVGKIIDTSYSNSIVRLLSNNRINKLSIKIELEKDVYGLLVGYKDGCYIVEGISDVIDIKEGALVKTTGLSENIPAGITIGIVKEVSTDNFDLAKTVLVKPGVDLNDISYISIVGKE